MKTSVLSSAPLALVIAIGHVSTLHGALIASWSGNGNADDSVAGRNGTLVNGAGFDSGCMGQAFRLDGGNDYVSIPDDAAWTFGDAPFTIALWANFDVVKGGSLGRLPNVLIGHDTGGYTRNKWVFFCDAGGSPAFHINGTGSVFMTAPTTFSPIIGEWHHFAITRSGSAYTFYADGVSLGTTTTSRTIPDASAPLTIGQAEGLGYFDGRLDEVRLYDEALSAAQIEQLCSEIPSLSSPVRSGTILVGDALRFSAEGPAGKYAWDFGDGRTSSLRSPGLMAFPTEGEFEIAMVFGDPLGEYYQETRTITVVADPGAVPDLVVTALSVPPQLAIGQAVDISYTVRNAGNAAATGSTWADAIYLSRDEYLDTSDTRLASVPVAHEVGVGQTYQGTMTVTLPPTLKEGAYCMILSVDDEWEVLEQHQLNNELAVSTDLAIPLLEEGIDHTAPFLAGRVSHYYRINAPAGGRSLLLSLDSSVAGLEVYARFGVLPTRGTYDYRMHDNQLLIPAATAGTWYILVYGEAMSQAGQYTIGYESTELKLLDVSPRQHGTAGPLQLTLTGTGFLSPMQVALVGVDSTTYFASDVEVNSFTRITATFAAGEVPAGIYTVRVARLTGESDELPGIFEMVAGGEADLEVKLILPARFGYHQLATAYVEYTNTGTVAMPAPILVTTATQNDRQAAILTMDKTLVSKGLWTAVMPEGFANSVQCLAWGETLGILQPGESRRVPVYYVGWQQPWNFSYPPLKWAVGVLDANNSVPVDWAAMKAAMRPSYVREDAWDVVWSNFTAQAGATWGDYVAMLSRYALYLDRQGQRVEDIAQLLAFAFRQADALSPLPVLAGATDAAVQAPGLPIVFRRMHAQPISRRFELGPLGRGWTHNWQYTLVVREDGTVVITDMTGTPRIFQPDARPGRPYLAKPWDHGVLRAVAGGGFTLTEADGLVRAFSAGGKLDYVEDTNGNRITCTHAGNFLTNLTHSSGQGLQIVCDGGLISSITDDQGRQTRYTYASEHLVSVQAYDGRVTTYGYSAASDATQHALVEIGLPNGVRRSYAYDSRGRLAGIARDGNAEPIAFAYGSEGQVTATDALGNASRFFLDYSGRIVKVESPLGGPVSFSFDELRQLVAVTDPAGLAWTFGYDNRGNLTSFTDAMRQITRFTYTPALNRLASLVDANGNRTGYGRDTRGNLTAIGHADGSSETWTYDGHGNPIAWANRRGHAIGYTHDAAGRITHKTYADSTHVDYTYDARGNLVEAVDANGTTSFAYDANDYLTRIDYPAGRWLAFTQDAAGRRASSLDQTGRRLDYHYDTAGRLEWMTDENAAELVRYAYDAAGRLARKTVGNGVYTDYTYNAAWQLGSLVNRAPDGTVISHFDYTYDLRGRRIAMATHYGTWTYEYDDIGQLTRAVLASTAGDIPNQDLRYIYDALGNRIRTTVNGVEEEYGANHLNQYTQVGDRTYTYDLDGNLIQETGPGGTTVYTYNDENRLIGVTRGADTWQYTYDALGNRVAAAENGAITHYVIDPIGLGNIVGEYDESGRLLARYDHGFGLLNRTGAAGSSAYYTFDALGNVSEVTGVTGAVNNTYAYRPFGETLRHVAPISNPFEFVGQWGVTAEGNRLSYMRARFYQSAVGRFLNDDPLGIVGGDINLLRYSRNRPTMFIDPKGLSFWDIFKRWGDVNRTPPEKDYYFDPDNPNDEGERARKRIEAGRGLEKAGKEGLRDYVRDSTTTGIVEPIGHLAGILGQLLAGFGDLLNVGRIVFDGVNALPPQACPINNLPETQPFGGVDSISSVSRAASSSRQSQTGSDTATDCLPIDPDAGGTTGTVGGWDPNEKIGPAGYGEQNHVTAGESLPYRVDFENLESATAPAQVVTVFDPLSSDLDPATFELTEIGFGDVLIVVPEDKRQYFETVVLYSLNNVDFEVQIEAGINVGTGGVFAYFYTIDPETGWPPPVEFGFLPPEDDTGRGQGHISYVIQHRPGLPSGTEIRNVAQIQFDFGLIIGTNQVNPLDPSQGTDPAKEALVTIDAGPPTSHVLPLPRVSTSAFEVAWTGQDDAGGSGIGGYDIYVQDNDGPWTLWQDNTPQTSAMFTGQHGHTYAFYSIAVDNVGHSETAPSDADAATTVLLLVPADLDRDGDVDGFDFLTFANCYNGSSAIGVERPPLAACENLNADLEGDGDVDGFDFLSFSNCFNGSDQPPLCP